MRQELLKAAKVALHYGQWGEELVAELCAQTELVQDVLCFPWASRWVTVLLKQLLWNSLRRPSVEEPADANVLACGKGMPTAAEGDILPGFPGVAVP